MYEVVCMTLDLQKFERDPCTTEEGLILTLDPKQNILKFNFSRIVYFNVSIYFCLHVRKEQS